MVSIDKALVQTLVTGVNKTKSQQAKTAAQLASGSRINSAADDAAGLAIADALKSDTVTFNRARLNAADASSLTQVAEGALQETSNITTRMAELAAQASNGTLSDSQRSALDAEYQALASERDRIMASTEFNGEKVFNGQSKSIQVGNDGTSASQIDVNTPDSSNLYGDPGSIATKEAALQALDQSQLDIASLSQETGKLGAAQSRLEVADKQLAVQAENSAAAESQIRDVDYAEATAKQLNNNIKLQAGVALLAQANQDPNSVARLLQ